jgi:hypothetical protein
LFYHNNHVLGLDISINFGSTQLVSFCVASGHRKTNLIKQNFPCFVSYFTISVAGDDDGSCFAIVCSKVNKMLPT